jgi:hypothetical protein
MSRRGFYGFERRRKDEVRRQKQAAKQERRKTRAETGATGPEMGEAQTTGAEPGTWEWFSPSRSRTVTTPEGARPQGDGPDDWVLLTETGEAPGPDA